MPSPELQADEVVKQLLDARRKRIAEGLDYSEQEVRVAIQYAANDLAGLPMALGMLTSSLRTIRRRLAVIEVLTIILVCVLVLGWFR